VAPAGPFAQEKTTGYFGESHSFANNSSTNGQASVSIPLASSLSAEPINLAHAVKSSEHQAILAVLQSTHSRTEAAEKLGISPRTLRYKLAQLRDRGMSVSLAE